MIATITVLPDADDVATFTVENFTNVYFYSQYVEVRSRRGRLVSTLSIPNDNFISIKIEKQEELKMKKYSKEWWIQWLYYAGVRALKTVAQTAVGVIGASAVISDVNWIVVASSALLAGVVSLLTSVGGLPEIQAPTEQESFTMDLEHEKRLTEIEALSKSNAHRLDEVEKRQDNLDELVGTVKMLAVREENVETDVKEIKQDVKSLTSKSGQRWDKIIDQAIIVIVGAILGYILANVGF